MAIKASSLVGKAVVVSTVFWYEKNPNSIYVVVGGKDSSDGFYKVKVATVGRPRSGCPSFDLARIFEDGYCVHTTVNPITNVQVFPGDNPPYDLTLGVQEVVGKNPWLTIVSDAIQGAINCLR